MQAFIKFTKFIICWSSSFIVLSCAPLGLAPVQLPTPPPGQLEELGAATWMSVRQTDPQRRWAIVCVMDRDIDESGAMELGIGYHGDLSGDPMRAYLMGLLSTAHGGQAYRTAVLYVRRPIRAPTPRIDARYA